MRMPLGRLQWLMGVTCALVALASGIAVAQNDAKGNKSDNRTKDALAREDEAKNPSQRPPGTAKETTAERAAKDPKKAKAPGETISSYIPVSGEEPFADVMARDKAQKAGEMEGQKKLLEARYDLSDKPSDVKMSGGRRAVQQGVRVKLAEGMTWQDLAKLSPDQIKDRNVYPAGFRPLPHTKHVTGGQVFPQNEIDTIRRDEKRELQRFDIDFDLPDHLTPEFPPPVFLTNRPDLGDISKGQAITRKNFFDLTNGILTPVQIEGLRLLLTPFPQQQFNQTDDRKLEVPDDGVACLDCHVNFHTNAAFHLTPDIRPQEARFRIDTVSLRGVFNQQIHGSKRSLRSVEDFSQFEQRTAYFDGDHVIATKKGLFIPERTEQVSLMAQMQNMIDFPPAPKLDPTGRLDPSKGTEAEKRGSDLFFGKARCAECHLPPAYMDQMMHDLHTERFYTPEMVRDNLSIPDGPIKTFTLRGIKDSPPYMHDGRLMTLDDTVEFFNLILGLQLNPQEKSDLVAFMLVL